MVKWLFRLKKILFPQKSINPLNDSEEEHAFNSKGMTRYNSASWTKTEWEKYTSASYFWILFGKNISQRTIEYIWKNKQKYLYARDSNSLKCRNITQQMKYQEINGRLFSRCSDRKDQGYLYKKLQLILHALGIAQDLAITDFTPSNGLLYRVKTRGSICSRNF